ncbi:ALQxL family class IV lanthipeptide [Streptomyces sp. TP-A0874]|nr:ALQxL family class IV lanthipeptide [Streptomyces sp. TP-A0874]
MENDLDALQTIPAEEGYSAELACEITCGGGFTCLNTTVETLRAV